MSGEYPAGSGTREQIKRIQNVLFKKQKTNKNNTKTNTTNPPDLLRPESRS